MTTNGPLEAYLGQLRSLLPGLTLAEREDIIEEIRTHVYERVQTSGISVAETLERLGPAEELAAAYGKGALVRRARRTFSPWVILRAAYAWAMTGFYGTLAFIAALLGYALGAGFMVCGLLKPLFPEQMGLWTGTGIFQFGFVPPDVSDAHELLGPWFTQVTLALGILTIIVTTVAMRKLLPKVKQWRHGGSAPVEPQSVTG